MRLREAAPDLAPMLAGAEVSLRADDPDRIRAVAVRLRELLDHLVRRLAPDAEVHAQRSGRATEPVTRRQRLRYILGKDAVMAPVVEYEIRVALAIVDVLNTGTHEAVVHFGEGRLRLLVARVKGIVMMLLTADEE